MASALSTYSAMVFLPIISDDITYGFNHHAVHITGGNSVAGDINLKCIISEAGVEVG